MVKFLTGVDYLNPKKEVFKAVKEKGTDTKGNKITQVETIVFSENITAD